MQDSKARLEKVVRHDLWDFFFLQIGHRHLQICTIAIGKQDDESQVLSSGDYETDSWKTALCTRDPKSLQCFLDVKN